MYTKSNESPQLCVSCQKIGVYRRSTHFITKNVIYFKLSFTIKYFERNHLVYYNKCLTFLSLTSAEDLEMLYKPCDIQRTRQLICY